jgi:hypothetical protein
MRRMALDWTFRFRAAGVHLGISGLVAALAAALVFLFWYPGIFSTLAGGTSLFVLITGVDVAMGPLITLVVFDRRKPRAELFRDLTIVGLLQVGALVYGLNIVYSARPVVMALEDDRFRVVSASDVLLDELPKAQPGFTSLSLAGPTVVGTAPIAQQDKLDAFALAVRGYDIGTRPTYWRSWAPVGRQQALRNAKPLTELAERHPPRRQELTAAALRTGVPLEQLRYLPIVSLRSQAVALIDMRSGDIAGYAAIDGF